jgi:3-phosphoglycerate kinase
MAKKTVADIDVRGKRVLVRVDFNVPSKTEKSPTTAASCRRFRRSRNSSKAAGA